MSVVEAKIQMVEEMHRLIWTAGILYAAGNRFTVKFMKWNQRWKTCLGTAPSFQVILKCWAKLTGDFWDLLQQWPPIPTFGTPR
jgi:hypothetical protein